MDMLCSIMYHHHHQQQQQQIITWSGDGGAPQSSDPRTWGPFVHRGHRLWAAMSVAFWLYVYKVQRCRQASSHDWKTCPYAHKGERARRRDPRAHPYLAMICPEFRESQLHHRLAQTGGAPSCARGLRCRYAHGVFELWLHPARFRTVVCEAGPRCPRRVCFFAHSAEELRAVNDPVPLVGMPPPPLSVVPLPRAPAAAPLSFPQRVDLAMQAMAIMPGMVRMYGASPSSSPAATVPRITSPDDDEDHHHASKSGVVSTSEDGSVAGDYPYFDIIKDMM